MPLARRRTVVDIDRGYEKFKKQMMTLKRNKPFVAVGVIGERAWRPKDSPDGPSKATVVDVAMFNEFGTRSIPARPFMRHTFDANQKRFVEMIRQIRISMALGKTSPEIALRLVGLFAQKEIQATISNAGSLFAQNADSTIAKKGSTAPLIDTGQLRQSITFEVRNGN